MVSNNARLDDVSKDENGIDVADYVGIVDLMKESMTGSGWDEDVETAEDSWYNIMDFEALLHKTPREKHDGEELRSTQWAQKTERAMRTVTSTWLTLAVSSLRLFSAMTSFGALLRSYRACLGTLLVNCSRTF